MCLANFTIYSENVEESMPIKRLFYDADELDLKTSSMHIQGIKKHSTVIKIDESRQAS
jgi:hypothetical protein